MSNTHKAKKNRAVFCMARNESVFLPKWVRYYRQFFDDEDIFILDHNSDDGSVDQAVLNTAINVRHMNHPYFNDFLWYTPTICKFQAELLESYHTVVFAEPDEIIYHHDGLDNYILSLRKSCIRTKGYDIVQDRATESVIDLEKPILLQRRFWRRNTYFDKALISSLPMEWSDGFHVSNNCDEIDPHLLLLHLHFMDFDVALKKLKEVKTWKTPERSIELNLGIAHRYSEAELLEGFDKVSLALRVGKNNIQKIPQYLRNDLPI